ncbi:hypothetical protein KDA23_04010 [Candidatus Saccharibacteria bacterium]|nr:hypothetical protein [Candidatus Saccharibacteria bacterium]
MFDLNHLAWTISTAATLVALPWVWLWATSGMRHWNKTQTYRNLRNDRHPFRVVWYASAVPCGTIWVYSGSWLLAWLIGSFVSVYMCLILVWREADSRDADKTEGRVNYVLTMALAVTLSWVLVAYLFSYDLEDFRDSPDDNKIYLDQENGGS